MGGGERLEAALMRPLQTFSAMDLFPDLEDKVAALMHGMIKGHPFVDGNKRTVMRLGLAGHAPEWKNPGSQRGKR